MLRVAKTENGMVEGLPCPDPRVTAFKGIPFAKPPIGENRWRAPQPCDNWEGTLKTYGFGPISIQDTPALGTDIYCREWHVDSEVKMDEDCLYLNVWTPAKTTQDKLPVMVWFFGGAFQWGYTNEMEFDGERIARRDIILVTVNYRLGVIGFLAHPEISKEQPDAPANFGHLDQKAGLDWVIRNIEAFGGDPENITIAGQSAGGGSVLAQMTHEDNFNKIKGAVILSAMIRSPYGVDPFFVFPDLKQAEKMGETFFEFLGVETLEQARALDAIYIRDKYAEYAVDHQRFATVIDGQFCVGDSYERFLAGQRARVPVISGNTEDEFLNFIQAKDEAELETKAREVLGEDADKFLAMEESKKLLANTTDMYAPVSGIECSVKRAYLESEKIDSDFKGYYYRFMPMIPGYDNPGTFHSVDLWFFFETLGKCWRPFRGPHYDLSRQMCNYLTNFVKNHDPNGLDDDGSEMPKWETYGKDNCFNMCFKTEGPVAEVKDEPEFIELMMQHVY